MSAATAGDITLGAQRPTRDSMSCEEATLSDMWESAAIVELLERKGYNPCLNKGIFGAAIAGC